MALTAAGDRRLHLWDLASGEELQDLQGHSNTLVTAVAYLPDGARAVSADADGHVILWDLQRGSPIMQADVQAPTIPGWFVNDPPPMNVAVDAAGRVMLTTAGDGTLVQWDLTDAAEVNRFVGPGQIWGMALSPDGKQALSGTWGDGLGITFGDDNAMRLWDTVTGELVREFVGHTAVIIEIDVSDDGQRALTASADGTVRLWDLQTGEVLQTIEAHTGGVFVADFTPDERYALTASVVNHLPDSGVTLWDLQTGEVVRRLREGALATTFAFSEDGRSVYVGGNAAEEAGGIGTGLEKYDLATGELLQRFSVPYCCTGFAIDPDEQFAYLANNVDGVLREWDLTMDEEARTFGIQASIRPRVALSGNGRLLFTSTTENELRIWDVASGEEIRQLASDGYFVGDVVMSEDALLGLSPGAGGGVVLWDFDLPTELEDVQAWIAENRFVREVSCAERALYRIEPLCD